MTDIDATLAERGAKYGSLMSHGEISQGMKSIMRGAPSWKSLRGDQAEALDMIVHKIARIVNGDPNYIDSWHDIIGYAKLVEDRLVKP